MVRIPNHWQPRRIPHRDSSHRLNKPMEEAADREQERYQKAREIFDRVYPELQRDFEEWYIIIDPITEQYHLFASELEMFDTLRLNPPPGNFIAFRLTESGSCGRV